jgi:hypothetical protein
VGGVRSELLQTLETLNENRYLHNRHYWRFTLVLPIATASTIDGCSITVGAFEGGGEIRAQNRDPHPQPNVHPALGGALRGNHAMTKKFSAVRLG